MNKRRGTLGRIFAATMIFWLGLVITDPLTLDACPMHGSHAMHGGAHSLQAEHHARLNHGGSPKKASHQCTCIGDCSVGGFSFATLPGRVTVAEAEIITIVEQSKADLNSSRRGLSDHTLPPANGPPAIS